jgi:hypothetical protein
MRLPYAEIEPYGSTIIVVIVDSQFTQAGPGDDLLYRLRPHFKTSPIMLISVEKNGFRAYAPFQTHLLLALIQLEELQIKEVDLDQPAAIEEELPF